MIQNEDSSKSIHGEISNKDSDTVPTFIRVRSKTDKYFFVFLLFTA